MDKLRAKRTIEQQINEANQRLAGLKARQKARDTRIQMILGKALLSVAQLNAINAQATLTLLNQAELKPNEERDIATVVDELQNIKNGTTK